MNPARDAIKFGVYLLGAAVFVGGLAGIVIDTLLHRHHPERR